MHLHVLFWPALVLPWLTLAELCSCASLAQFCRNLLCSSLDPNSGAQEAARRSRASATLQAGPCVEECQSGRCSRRGWRESSEHLALGNWCSRCASDQLSSAVLPAAP